LHIHSNHLPGWPDDLRQWDGKIADAAAQVSGALAGEYVRP
jgi:hypothetical protein